MLLTAVTVLLFFFIKSTDSQSLTAYRLKISLKTPFSRMADFHSLELATPKIIDSTLISLHSKIFGRLFRFLYSSHLIAL